MVADDDDFAPHRTLTCKRASDGQSEDYRLSDTTKLCSVLGALGFRLKPERCWLDREGTERVTFMHAAASSDPHRPGLRSKPLIKQYRSGELQRVDPQHPLLDGLRTIANLRALEHWQSTGQTHQLASPTSGRSLLVPGTPQKPLAWIKTLSLYRAAAFALLGYEVTELASPDARSIAYTIANVSAFAANVETAQQLITQHQALLKNERDAMSPLHPFAFAFDAAKSYHVVLSTVADEMTLLHYRARKSKRRATIYEHASKDAQHRTERFVSGLYL